MKTTIVISTLMLFVSCGMKKPDGSFYKKKGYHFPFDLDKPERIFDLAKDLDEISGIAFFEKNKLAAINDEQGKLYFINLKNSKTTAYKFGEDGDYEDIVRVHSEFWILKSNGDLTLVKNFKATKNDNQVYKTPLSQKNDTEGLAFDQKNSRLLIACKEGPNLGNGKLQAPVKAIYAFDLETKKLSKSPVFTINPADIEEASSKWPVWFIKLTKLFSEHESIFFRFSPSGIAIHPKTNNIYIISASNKYLLVLDEKGNYLYASELNAALFSQPEGIAFSPEGALYISNEANGGKARILEFIPKQF